MVVWDSALAIIWLVSRAGDEPGTLARVLQRDGIPPGDRVPEERSASLPRSGHYWDTLITTGGQGVGTEVNVTHFLL